MVKKVDWSQFDDWLNVGGPGGEWVLHQKNKKFNQKQKQIVENNATLLLKRKDWHEKVDAFEGALLTIEDVAKRKEKRRNYCIYFDGYEFDRKKFPTLDFFEYNFPCSVSFNSVHFGEGHVKFDNAIFSDGNINFENTKFGCGYKTFRETQFGNGDVYFHGACFGTGNVSFWCAHFGDGDVRFTSSKVEGGYIYFTRMHLSDETRFEFVDMNVKGSFYLNSNFLNTVFFTGLNVTESTILSNSTFKECPDFRDAYFGRPPEVAGMEVPPPEMEGDFFVTCLDLDDAARYRKLKVMALAVNDHDKDGKFFAYEMMAKRGHEITGFWELLANSFYYHVSYYGQSWIRPLIGMAISCFTFFWIYFIYAMGSLKCLENVWFSIRYSLLNTLPFVSALYRSSIQPKDYESGLMLDLDKMATVNDEMVNGSLGELMFFSFVQQFIGIVLLFFLLLGLRNRFRLK